MTDPLLPSALTAPLLSSAAMRAAIDDRARLQRMLDFEAALAKAEAAVGVIPTGAAGDIAGACKAERYDLASLGEQAARSGSIAQAIVAALTAEVAKRNAESAGYVHWGASSQDVTDTALVLELRAVIDVLVTDIDRTIKALTTLAGRHRRTLTLARSAMQPALPMPFGLKPAGYAAALARSRERLRRTRREALVLQFGGGAGTLAALGEHGLDVSMRLAALLDLPHPDAPWLSHRDRLAEVAAALAILAGTCGKIARDVALLMQAEIGEVADAPSNGRGASTTLPQARNAATAAAALSAAATAPQLAATILTAQMQEHERALGGGQIEWTTFPALARVTSGALQAVAEIAEGLQVDAERMKQNLEASMVCAEAVSFALAPKLGRAQAHAVVTELARKAQTDKRALRDVLAADERIKAQLDDAALDRLLRATNYQGAAQTFLDRLVASALGRLVRRPDEMRSRVPDLKAEASVAPAEPVVPAAAVPETTVPTPEPLAAPPAPAPEPPVPQPPAVPQPSALLPPAPQIAPVAEVSEPAPIATAEPDPAAKPAVAPATAEPDPDAKPAAEAATAPAEPPSALIEVFARVAAITDEITSDHPADHESKPA